MSNLENASDEEIWAEAERRKLAKKLLEKNMPYCSSCHKYKTYMGRSRSWREEPHCTGCCRPVENCTCSRI